MLTKLDWNVHMRTDTRTYASQRCVAWRDCFGKAVLMTITKQLYRYLFSLHILFPSFQACTKIVCSLHGLHIIALWDPHGSRKPVHVAQHPASAQGRVFLCMWQVAHVLITRMQAGGDCTGLSGSFPRTALNTLLSLHALPTNSCKTGELCKSVNTRQHCMQSGRLC